MPFVKGQSGNPGGRRGQAGLADYVRTNTRQGTELVDYMLLVLRDKYAARDHRMKACAWLTERGFGKPPEFVEITGADGSPLFGVNELRTLTDDEIAVLEPIIAKLAAAKEQASNGDDGRGESS